MVSVVRQFMSHSVIESENLFNEDDYYTWPSVEQIRDFRMNWSVDMKKVVQVDRCGRLVPRLFERNQCDASYSMMDGLDRYVELISELSLPSNFSF